MKQITFMLPWVSAVTDRRKRQLTRTLIIKGTTFGGREDIHC